MRRTQRDQIRSYFKSNPLKFIPLYEITAFAAQYNARISELRWGEDMHIINLIKEVTAKQRHTGFVYDPDKSWKEYCRKSGKGTAPGVQLYLFGEPKK